MTENNTNLEPLVGYTSEPWLYLPSRLVWINTAHVVAINGWHDDDDPSVIVAYTISDSRGNEWETETNEDIAAVRAWLEGRA